MISLAVNAALGWWWLDSCAGLVASAVIGEGRDAWHGNGCC